MGTFLFHAGPEVTEDPGHKANIGQIRNPFEEAGLPCEEGCGKNRESGIFGAACRDGSLKRASPFYAEYIHDGRLLFGLSGSITGTGIAGAA